MECLEQQAGMPAGNEVAAVLDPAPEADQNNDCEKEEDRN
jgi:hypothetical protein